MDTQAFAVQEIWWVYVSLNPGLFHVPATYCFAGDQVTITTPDCSAPLGTWTVTSATCQGDRVVFEAHGEHDAPDQDAPDQSSWVNNNIRGVVTSRGRLRGGGLAYEEWYGAVFGFTGEALDSCPCPH